MTSVRFHFHSMELKHKFSQLIPEQEWLHAGKTKHPAERTQETLEAKQIKHIYHCTCEAISSASIWSFLLCCDVPVRFQSGSGSFTIWTVCKEHPHLNAHSLTHTHTHTSFFHLAATFLCQIRFSLESWSTRNENSFLGDVVKKGFASSNDSSIKLQRTIGRACCTNGTSAMCAKLMYTLQFLQERTCSWFLVVLIFSTISTKWEPYCRGIAIRVAVVVFGVWLCQVASMDHTCKIPQCEAGTYWKELHWTSMKLGTTTYSSDECGCFP